MPNSIREAMNRGNNLLIVVFMALMTIGVIAHQFSEDELLDRVDDFIFIILGIVTVAWYFRGRNRYKSSLLLFSILVLAVIDKVLALLNEVNDSNAIFDEYAIGVVLVFITILSGIIILRTRDRPQKEVVSPLPNIPIPQTGKMNDQE